MDIQDQAILLHRIDPAGNMARFYALSIEPSLFGDLALTRRWGRIGTLGSQIIELHADRATATLAFRRHERRKRQRGYR
ncbi:WGR domain-containing protein [Mesorhizobium sp. CAU 1741]|uniref:WGR domain-containing protein n=1 Tax=Mesorhizobium sp. CAU 1741 TaxID=3140366 RepID=UPI00325AF57A